ncbi:hypothetical protein HSX44_00900 [Wolbachia endosymbiont of Onchocerca gibsoni]|uniref:hypothetical protein n=1 Tax=Wolbachia endosymbiont of Onchocerca gibsoni TaxID=118986 RepID=UPI0023D7EB48|nr:hypothetical protein [Wolbachia endosymbiont of Onchocerca gibsoni]MDF0607465.1 hypothetical protein [Wolbachia endosymbiont of Onchocerca gibsoni]MDF0607466.1 hypothetical protein [Wolbachia endosymbiont of Onchocerca gibsoni]
MLALSLITEVSITDIKLLIDDRNSGKVVICQLSNLLEFILNLEIVKMCKI